MWRVFIIHVFARRLAMPPVDVVIGNTPLFFSAQGIVAKEVRGEENSDEP